MKRLCLRTCAGLGFLFLGLGVSSWAATVDSVAVPSAVLHRTARAVVVRPDAYAAHPAEKFPVVYLLHGFGGDEREFLIHFADRNLLGRLADKYGVVFVTPAAEKSFYLDSPQDAGSQYESFFVRELLPWVDAFASTRYCRSTIACTPCSKPSRIRRAPRCTAVFSATA